MSRWCAVSYGVLDLAHELEDSAGPACAVMAIYPAEPILLTGDVARLWLRLVHGSINPEELSEEERRQLDEFATFGIASTNLDHPNRVRELSRPWLESFQHELVYALISSLARASDIEVVFIKGPFLQHQGLRRRAHSADVDVLVNPDQVERLADIVTAWGWTPRPAVLEGTRIRHSITLAPGGWGCEVDIHWRMPGYAKPDHEAFNIIRNRSTSFTTAGVSLAVPDTATNAVLGALHTLRPRYTNQPQTHMVHIARSFLRLGGKETVKAAQALHADLVLYDALSTEYPGALTKPTYDMPSNWNWRTQQGQIRSYLHALKQIPWYKRPAITWRLLWPPPHFFTASGEVERPTWLNLFRARCNRIWRGLRKTFTQSR